MNKVFVYGTLKNGHGNHRWLLKDRSEFVGKATTNPEFTMVDLGAFPGVVPGGHTSIVGEVYLVDDDVFGNLDGLEGYPSFYNRMEVETDHGMAWMYFLDSGYLRHPVVDSGEWDA